jgi:hypothetical protein
MRIVPAGIFGAAIVVSAAACGSASSSGSLTSAGSRTPGGSPLAGLTADQIVQKAVNDLAAASSVRIVGKQDSSGQDVVTDLTDVHGQGCRGTMTSAITGSASPTTGAGNGTITMIELHGTAYAEFTQNYLKSMGVPASILTEMDGKYVKVTSTTTLSGFDPLCNPSDWAKGLDAEVTGFVRAGTATVDGQPALALTGPKSGADGTVFISESSTPEILSFHALAANQGSFSFSDYNARVNITAPPAADIADSNPLGI